MSWIITGKEADPLLLDSYSGAGAAYSLRQLSWAYGGPVVRVRRDNDNAEQNFTATEVSDGTLAAWVGAGNDGFVRTWYDQSGNNRNASEPTQASQPQIVLSGAVITQSSEPSIKFDGSNDKLLLSINPISTQEFSIFTVVANSNLAGNQEIISNWDANNGITSVFFGTNGSTVRFTDNFTSAGAFGAASALKEVTAISSAGDAITYLNGSQLAAKGSALSIRVLTTNWYIGVQGSLGQEFWNGHISEIILYGSDQSVNRSAIQSNINAHYSLY
jgi:hypothetical protein